MYPICVGKLRLFANLQWANALMRRSFCFTLERQVAVLGGLQAISILVDLLDLLLVEFFLCNSCGFRYGAYDVWPSVDDPCEFVTEIP